MARNALEFCFEICPDIDRKAVLQKVARSMLYSAVKERDFTKLETGLAIIEGRHFLCDELLKEDKES